MARGRLSGSGWTFRLDTYMSSIVINFDWQPKNYTVFDCLAAPFEGMGSQR